MRRWNMLVLAGIMGALVLVCLQACTNGSDEGDAIRFPSSLETAALKGPVESQWLESADVSDSTGPSEIARQFVMAMTYDEKGNRTKVVFPDAEGLPGQPQTQEYEYDGKGMVIRDKWYQTDGTILWDLKYEYESSHTKIARYASKADGSPFGKATFVFNGRGFPVTAETVSYNADKSLHSMIRMQYDDTGNMVEQSSYYPADVLVSKSTQRYDALGNEIEVAIFSGEGSLRTRRTYSGYGNDDRGNWTQRTCHLERFSEAQAIDEKESVEYRVITYYPE